MKLNKFLSISIAILALITAFFWNELNSHNLKKAHIKLRENQTVITEDDASYLNPYKRLDKNGSTYTTQLEKYTSSVRPPGYGTFYYFSLKLGGEKHALYFLKIVQCLFFAFSVFCLFELTYFFTKANWLSSIVALIYGILPFTQGFLYYTLTEGITPALFLSVLYFAMKTFNEKEIRVQLMYLFFASSFFSFLIIVRPFMIVFLPFILVILFLEWFRTKGMRTVLLNLLLFTSISLSGLFTWQIRGGLLLGKFLGLHPIYQNEIPGVFRKPHEALWNMFKGWEASGAHFHETIVPFWEATMKLDTSEQRIDEVIQRLPKSVVKSIGKKELKWGFILYRKAILAQKPYFDKQQVMPHHLLKSEQRAYKNFERLAVKFSSQNLYVYHVQTPLKVLKSMVFHSNLSMYQFQHTYRGAFWTEALRYLCFAIHSLAFVLLPFAFFLLRDLKIRILIIGLFVFIFYLFYFQRGIEERYTLPILPLLIIFEVMTIKQMIVGVKKNKFLKKLMF